MILYGDNILVNTINGYILILFIYNILLFTIYLCIYKQNLLNKASFIQVCIYIQIMFFLYNIVFHPFIICSTIIVVGKSYINNNYSLS